MANPRQRSKARSHKSHKPSLNQKRRIHSKLRRKPTLNGPEVLQESWDKHKTVFQNYAALGLLPTIPLPSRSSSKSYKASLPFLPPHLRASTTTSDAFRDSEDHNEDVEAASAVVAPRAGFGRIIRDEEGNVVDIIIDQEPGVADNEGMDEGEDEDDEESERRVRHVEAKTDVVRSLEQLAATSTPVIRHPSTSEHAWLVDLVRKYGDDTDKMSRDRQLNVWQKTSGEIGRMIKKAGGRERLLR